MILNTNNYVARGKTPLADPSVFLVKPLVNNKGRVSLADVQFPPEWVGKRVRFKVEVIENVQTV